MSKCNSLSKEQLKKQKQDKKDALKAKIAAMDVKQRKKYYLGKAVSIVGICFAVILVLYFALWAVNSLLSSHKADNGDASIPESRIINVPYEHQTYTPFEPDWDKDVYQDPEFLEKNLDLVYEEAHTDLSYTLDKPIGAEHEGHRFFKAYFEMLRSGNYEIYPSLFAESYIPETSYEQNINRKFPPQMVYDVTITEAGRFGDSYNGTKCTRGIYIVNYRILKNDNLFRNDIGKDGNSDKDVARAIMFELITFNAGRNNEETYIHNIYTEISPSDPINQHS